MNSHTSIMQAFAKNFNLLINGSNRKFLYLALIYGISVSLLTLAVPISVQMLINTVANIASEEAIVTLAIILFFLLCISGLLIACQSYALELFQRRFYANMVGHFSLRTIFADQQYFRSINGTDLSNRYFDIMRVQTILPTLVTGFLATILQMLVGIVLVSFYHPWLLIFNFLFMLCLFFICRIWGLRAMATALDVSLAKYRTARHLEDLAQLNDFYKSETKSNQAIKKSDTLSQYYIDTRKHHFRNTFSQQIALLFLYASFSALLLGLGGILVIKGELTLGQLIAAELILIAVFASVSRFGYYLNKFYELNASLEEIGILFEVPTENLKGNKHLDNSQLPSLVFDNIKYRFKQQLFKLNLKIDNAAKVLVKSSNSSIQLNIIDLVRRYTAPIQGRVLINEEDIQDYLPSSLRNKVTIIDKPNLAEGTIIEYLRIHSPNASLAEINDVIDCVELTETIQMLKDGFDTPILANGEPLRTVEVLRLKLAGALLSKPQILILNESFDSISHHRRNRIFMKLCKIPDMLLIYFSNHQDLKMFDRYLYIGLNKHKSFKTVDDLSIYEENAKETS